MNEATGRASGALASRLGSFVRTFRREAPGEVAAAVARAGYPLAHWNFAAIGRPTLGGYAAARVRNDLLRWYDEAKAL